MRNPMRAEVPMKGKGGIVITRTRHHSREREGREERRHHEDERELWEAVRRGLDAAVS